MLDNITSHIVYRFLVVFAVLPFTGHLFTEQPFVSAGVLLSQVPWFYTTCCKE